MTREEGLVDSLTRIREKWLEGSPKEKRGVTERYVIFGEARKWMIEQVRAEVGGLVLDVGFGHGFLSYEMAVRTDAEVVGIDFLLGDQLRIARRGVRVGELKDQISWVVGDARKPPFANESFDAVVSFLALQDVNMTGGKNALTGVLESSLRVLRSDGVFAFADNMFPECAEKDSQKLYWRIHKEEFQAALPSKESIIKILKESGLHDLKERLYDPSIRLSLEQAKVELTDIVEAKPFGRTFDFGNLWGKYESEIEKSGLSYPAVLLIGGRMSNRPVS